MKKIVFLFTACLFAAGASAQIQVPQPSPTATMEQEVGLTQVILKYSRPGMRGRAIFGDLVPYGETWRTGANNNTTISFNTDITIAGKKLKEGTYSIYTVPEKDKWEVIFYKDANNWGLPEKWDDDKIALKATAQVQKMPINMETFTIIIDEIHNDSAALNFLWENTVATLTFEVPTDDIAMSSIDRILKGPSAGDYHAAAAYYHDEKKDLDKAYEWIKKAVEMGNPEAYWVIRRKALIEYDLGKKKEAIATAKEALVAAQKAGNKDYIKLNEDSLKEWGVK